MILTLIISILCFALATQCGMASERYASKCQDGLAGIASLATIMWVSVAVVAGLSGLMIA